MRIMPSTKGESGTQMKLSEENEFVVSIFYHDKDDDEMRLEINNAEIVHELLQHYFNRNNRIVA